MEILLTKSEGIFKYIKIAESSLGLNYSGTIIYFCSSKDDLLWGKACDLSPSLPERKKRFFHFFKKKDHVEKLDEEVVPDKSDEIILSALESVFSKIKMLACSQLEGKSNCYMECMVEGCRIVIIYIHVILKNKDDDVTAKFYIPLKMFVKDADSFDYYNGSSFVYFLKANDDIAEIKKNLERISRTDFFSSKNIF
jgi:hypothetical protein